MLRVDHKQKSGGKPGVPGGAAPLGWKPAFLPRAYQSRLNILVERQFKLIIRAKQSSSQGWEGGLAPAPVQILSFTTWKIENRSLE